MPPDFTILSVLRRHGVPFAVVGGHAVIFHGYRRSTEDLDLVWLRTPESELALTAALIELNARYIGKAIDPATGIERMHPVNLSFVQANHLMMLWTDVGGFLDLFDFIPGHPQVDVKELLSTTVDQAGLHFASLAWLRKMKHSAARQKDLLDLENLPGGEE
jgi:hypothetical protein